MQDPVLQRQTERQSQQALGAYVNSQRWEQLDDVEMEPAIAFVKLFIDACFKDLGVAPAQADAEQLREVLLAHVAPRISTKRAGADYAVRVIQDYHGSLFEGDAKAPTGSKKVFTEAEKEFPAIIRGEAKVEVERVQPLRAETAKAGRNDPCPCGSGKKFKKCCMGA